MNGLRKAYLKLGDEKRGEDLVRTYTRVGWSELKKGDVVVLYDPDGSPVEDGAEHHLVEDPWFEPDLHLHVIKTADPVRVIHKEANHGGAVADEARAGALPGEDAGSVQEEPGPHAGGGSGEVPVRGGPDPEGEAGGAG